MADSIPQIPEKVIDNIIVKRIANMAIAIIRKRTTEGKFSEGSSQYSTTPLPLPFGKFSKEVQGGISTDQLRSGKYKIFSNRLSGNTWIIVPGGYKEYRALAGKANDVVSLNWSGRMLRNLGIIEEEENKASIGFSSAEENQKALYHNVMGAGKSRKLHRFMFLSDEEIKTLTTAVEKDIAKKLISKNFR